VIQGDSSQKKKGSSTGMKETPGIGSETRPRGPRSRSRFGRSNEDGFDGSRSGGGARSQTNLERRPTPSQSVAVCSSDFLLAGRYCRSHGRLGGTAQGMFVCGFRVSGRANNTLLQGSSAYFRLFQLNSGYFRVTNKKGFRGNPATCCRFVADVLPIKSLPINNVADVADF
jgi:hypothetical protein